MLCFNTVRDVDKLQKLQNRCLRTCFDIYDPMETGIVRLHEMARVNTLSNRRDLHLLNVMFSLKLNNKYKKESMRVTRSTERYEFKTEILHKDIYAKSPFYKGVCLWNNIPLDCQRHVNGIYFKNTLKKHLNIFLLIIRTIILSWWYQSNAESSYVDYYN